MEMIVMPKLGFNMDEGKLVTWYKNEGDKVKKGESLFAIETDKTSIDVEATDDGTVLALLIEEGETVPVTLPIAFIGEEGEDISTEKEIALSKLGGNGDGDKNTSTTEEKTSVSITNEAGVNTNAKEKSSFDFDLIVIGGGPGGYVAAIKAAQEGLKTAIIEKDKFGGVCLNKGCIPTKTLLRSIESLLSLREAEKYGVIDIDIKKAALDMKKIQERKKEISASLVSGVQALLSKNKVKVIKGEAKILDKNTIEAEGEKFSTENIIIATGSETKGLPGKDTISKKDILTSDEILNLKEIPKEIVIIGGGVIGVEFAYFLANAGSKVTIVEFLDRILPMVDAEITEMVTKNLEGIGIKIYTSAKVTKITDREVKFEKSGKETLIKTKNVLLSVGRTPSLGGLDFDTIGIKKDKGAILTDNYLRTNIPNIYAIGDCNGKLMLAHTASKEGIVAVLNIKGENKTMNYDTIPSAIYIKPEIASVGLTEEQAKEKGLKIKVGKFPLLANGKSKVEGDDRGLIKIIRDEKYGEILGAHFYCLHATEMISEVVVAMNAEATAEEVAASIHPHPTVSESIMEAFEASVDKAIHI
ncbi:MAG: dihydrolipoyl dehydrogenase [Clostridiales Family XIII bacterium]|jgi:dihydrolipoamide dehydrogenase|nr:dihydrolipoyl dehydrogenase [Clostridiales Family XIII bacterium]